ncbi:MAG: SDR family NAD(P)-dependent oxidoreductase [Geminicoccaceae bacterium]
MSADVPPMDGRVVLVTGAGSGLGRAVALALAGAGAQVVATGRRRVRLEELDDEVQAVSGRPATLVPLDLADTDKLLPIGPSIYERFGRLDGLVHCAALLGKLMPTAQLDTASLRQAMEVNVLATQALIATLAPLLVAAPAGRALFLTDRLAARGRPYLATYAATKQAMEALVLAFAAEVRQTPLRVRLVAPPPMRSAMRAAAFPGESKAAQTPPETIAGRILDLLRAETLPEGDVLDL